jgi:hypothetical protein
LASVYIHTCPMSTIWKMVHCQTRYDLQDGVTAVSVEPQFAGLCQRPPPSSRPDFAGHNN